MNDCAMSWCMLTMKVVLQPLAKFRPIVASTNCSLKVATSSERVVHNRRAKLVPPSSLSAHRAVIARLHQGQQPYRMRTRQLSLAVRIVPDEVSPTFRCCASAAPPCLLGGRTSYQVFIGLLEDQVVCCAQCKGSGVRSIAKQAARPHH